MSRTNHACGTCGHRGELHDEPAGYVRCRCCRDGDFDPSGPVTVADTYVGGAVETRHYAPGDRRPVGGAAFYVHACDACLAEVAS